MVILPVLYGKRNRSEPDIAFKYFGCGLLDLFIFFMAIEWHFPPHPWVAIIGVTYCTEEGFLGHIINLHEKFWMQQFGLLINIDRKI